MGIGNKKKTERKQERFDWIEFILAIGFCSTTKKNEAYSLKWGKFWLISNNNNGGNIIKLQMTKQLNEKKIFFFVSGKTFFFFDTIKISK